MILSINIINIFSIIALIFKIIGIILLSLVGLIVLLFVLVFLVPIRYKVSAHNDRADMTDVRVKGRVTYLLHILSVHFGYAKEGGVFYVIKLFGINIHSSDKPKKPKKNKKRKKDKNKDEEYYEDPEGLSGVEDFTEEPSGDTADASDENPENTDISNHTGTSDNPDTEQELSKEERKALKQREKEEKRREKEEKKRIKQAKKMAKSHGSDSGSKLDAVKEKIEEVKKIINNPGNRRLFTKVKKELFYLLRHYLPRKLTGHLDFGMDSPDVTGKILGVMSLFPVFYKKGFSLTPDFNTDKTYFRGEIGASGRIRLIHLLKTAILLLLDKDFRRVVFKKKFY